MQQKLTRGCSSRLISASIRTAYLFPFRSTLSGRISRLSSSKRALRRKQSAKRQVDDCRVKTAQYETPFLLFDCISGASSALSHFGIYHQSCHHIQATGLSGGANCVILFGDGRRDHWCVVVCTLTLLVHSSAWKLFVDCKWMSTSINPYHKVLGELILSNTMCECCTWTKYEHNQESCYDYYHEKDDIKPLINGCCEQDTLELAYV